MAGDIQSAFAGGDFELGSSDAPSTQSQSEPAAQSAEPKTESRDAASSTSVKREGNDGSESAQTAGRDDRQSADDDDLKDIELTGVTDDDVKRLKKALKSERSLTRDHRKKLEQALAGSGMTDAERRQFAGRIQMLEQQLMQTMRTPQNQPTPKEDDRFDRLLGKDGFKVIEELVEERFAARDQVKKAEQERAIQIKAYNSRVKLLEQHPDGAEVIDLFRQLSQNDPRIEQYALASDDPAAWAYQYAKEVMRIQQYGSIDDLVSAERKKWEEERQQVGQGGNGNGQGQGERRAPLTLAGRRGASNVTPAQSRSLEQIMSF